MTTQQKNFILKNYPNLGGKQCANILSLPITTINSFAQKNKLSVTKEAINKIASKRTKEMWEKQIFKDEDYKVSSNFFTHCATAESAYILGLLWADGTIYKKDYQNRIAIECLEDDMNEFKKYFKKSGKWSIYNRKGRISGKNMTNLNTNNKFLTDFLIENDYNTKSLKSPIKILNLIPVNLKHYFFRGWIDGDGCFYINKKNSCFQFYLSGSYEQDWSSIEYLLLKLNLKYKINRIINKNNTKYSSIRITNKKGIETLGFYIYKNFKVDKIGLKRKYNKFLEIIS